MLKFYTIFHLNLMYSSIEEKDHLLVIKRCYWPLLKFADKGFPIGIEAPALTLELINSIDPEWIRQLRKLIKSKKIELIGSGYSQIIGPLVPAKVNAWNQKIGMKFYHKILGVKPEIALVNEMAFSGGLIEHYLTNNYKAIIMEWNNPKKFHPEWENGWRYFPQIAKGPHRNSIPVIWSKSIAFQKFQRVVHGDIEQEEYIEYLKSHKNKHDRYFPIYTNDVEIFDFRPGRFSTEAQLHNNTSEWERIFLLIEKIKTIEDFSFVLPSMVLNGLTNKKGGFLINLESPEQPIPVKKQDKYNINRWALTGRNDLEINSKCFSIYNHLTELKKVPEETWKELCYLWSSDFRTHITKKRWIKYWKRLNKSFNKIKPISIVDSLRKQSNTITLPFSKNSTSIVKNGRFVCFNSNKYYLEFNTRKGFSINKLIFKEVINKPLLGTLEHGYFDDISLGADFYSGHAVIEQPGEHKISDLNLQNFTISNIKDKYIIKAQSALGLIDFNVMICISSKSIKISKSIKYTNNTYKIIRPFHFTFIPESWNKSKLFYRTNNGGINPEKFYLKDSNCNQGSLYSPLISSIYGMGATEGVVDIGDNKKRIRFFHNTSECALIPKITFREESKKRYFLRLEYSGQEIDETFRTSNKPRTIKCSVEIFPLKK